MRGSQRSNYSTGNVEEYVPRRIKSLVTSVECDAAQHPLFRPLEETAQILASEKERQAVLDYHITGVSLRSSRELNQGQILVKD